MKKDSNIFIHKLLKAIADSLILIFIPLYILKQTNNINLSMLYLVIYSAFVMVFIVLLKKIIEKYGVLSIIIHFIPIVITEGIISFLPINIYTIIASAFLMSISQALYSIPINLIFTFNDKKTNVGKFQIATNIGKLIFTLISGYILSNITSSFIILSIISSIIYIVSSIPLFFSYKELIEKYKDNKKEKNIKIKMDPYFILFHICFGLFQPIMDNVVPLFLYLNNSNFQAVTILIAMVEFIKIIINYLTQFLVNKQKSIICVIISSIMFLSGVISLFFVKNNVALYIICTIVSVSFPLTFVPMFKLYCNYLIKTNNVFDGITNRDLYLFSLRCEMYSLSFIGYSLYPCLIVGIIVVPIMLFSEIKLLRKC